MADPRQPSRFAVSMRDLQQGAEVPVAQQVESVDPERGATMTSSADWADTRWVADGGGGSSLGAALALDGDGD